MRCLLGGEVDRGFRFPRSASFIVDPVPGSQLPLRPLKGARDGVGTVTGIPVEHEVGTGEGGGNRGRNRRSLHGEGGDGVALARRSASQAVSFRHPARVRRSCTLMVGSA